MKKKNFYKKHLICFNRKSLLALVLCCFIFMFLFTFSCTPIDDSISKSNNNITDDDNTATNKIEEESVSSDGSQAVDNGDNSTVEENNADENQSEEETKSGEVTINVYYADSMGEYLVGEARVVSSENKYVDALNELMKLPINNSLIQLIPDGTKINSVSVEDGLAKVDFSKEFVENRFQSDTVDILLVYSIVNTLTEFPEVNSVSFYIDGEKLDVLGMLDVKEPIFRRSDLIK
jgi:germination protein M